MYTIEFERLGRRLSRQTLNGHTIGGPPPSFHKSLLFGKFTDAASHMPIVCFS